MEYANIAISVMVLVVLLFFGYGVYTQTSEENECWGREHVRSYIKECSRNQGIDMCRYNAKVLFCRMKEVK